MITLMFFTVLNKFVPINIIACIIGSEKYLFHPDLSEKLIHISDKKQGLTPQINYSS